MNPYAWHCHSLRHLSKSNGWRLRLVSFGHNYQSKAAIMTALLWLLEGGGWDRLSSHSSHHHNLVWDSCVRTLQLYVGPATTTYHISRRDNSDHAIPEPRGLLDWDLHDLLD